MKKIPGPKELEKEIGDFSVKEVLVTVSKIVSPIVLPQEKSGRGKKVRS